MPHSELYLAVTQELNGLFDIKKLDANLENRELTYDKLSDLLRECNDAHFGITSTYQHRDGQHLWIRDAINSKPLDNRISHDSPTIQANNMLLRVLSRLRPIEHAIGKHLRDDALPIINKLRAVFELKMSLVCIATQGGMSDEEKLDYINSEELTFNNFLLNELCEANLTSGIYTQEDGEKLLSHYRNLSSLLVPARTMVTVTYDADAKVLHRETQYPVTIKTLKQKAELDNLKAVTPYPIGDEKTAHTTLKKALQQADSFFAEEIVADDTALPAQTRKTHLVGAKNAFVVKNELFFGVEQESINAQVNATPENTLWLGRTGSPAYIGKGETSSRVLEHTKEALEQIRLTAESLMPRAVDAPRLQLHMTILNTDSPLEHQSTIVDNIQDAMKDTDNAWSYAPTNWDGTNRLLEVSDKLNFELSKKPSGSSPSDKKGRLESVASIMQAAAKQPNFLSVVNCASGQDRTGTAVEKTTQDWIAERYALNGQGHSIPRIGTIRATSFNAAEITSHHVHGSPGMKQDSQTDGIFSEKADREFYRNSAKTNKKNKVDKVDFLKIPSERDREKYLAALDELGQFLRIRSDENNHPDDVLNKWSQNLLTSIIDSFGDTDCRKSPTAKSLHWATEALTQTSKTIKELQPGLANPHQNTIKNVQILEKLAENFTDKSSKLRKVGYALMFVGFAALLVIGVIAIIPTGGVSLTAVLAGLAGLNALSIGVASAGLATGIAGAAVAGYNHKRGVIANLSMFKSAVEESIAEAPEAKTSP
jgi:hypothetical protein